MRALTVVAAISTIAGICSVIAGDWYLSSVAWNLAAAALWLRWALSRKALA